MAMGAVTGAFMGGAGGFISGAGEAGYALSSVTQAGIYATAGAGAGATNAMIYGTDVGQGMLYGAGFSLAGYLAPVPDFQLFGDSAKSAFANIGNRVFNAGVTGAAFGATYAGMSGGDVWQGAAMGAMAWAAGESANMLIGHAYGYVKSGKGPKLEDGVFIYDVKGQRPFSVGGVIIADQDKLTSWQIVHSRKYSLSVKAHEISHALGKQSILGPIYGPIHILSQGISGTLGWLKGNPFWLSTHDYNLFERWWIEVPY